MENSTCKGKVLSVDDEESFGKLLRLNLERRGYEVRCESDSKKALQAALEFHPDVILLDIVMPGLDGGDLINLFRSNSVLKDVPTLMVTALVENNESRGAVLQAPEGVDMLAKPLRLDILCDWIGRKTGVLPQPAGGGALCS